MGNKVAAIMDQGTLVTDEIVIGLIEERLDDAGTGFIFDGFPRTLAQADALEALLDRKGQAIDAVIALEVDEDRLIERIVNRAKVAVAMGGIARADDNAESLKVRLMEYFKKTAPLIGYYHAKGKLTSIDGLGSIEEVKAAIEGIVFG